MTHARVQRLLGIALPVVLALAALAPLRSYDLFWHLATGRWIVEHGALPLQDPFTVASDRVPWINGEWLFEIAAYGIQSLGDVVALAWGRALLAAAVFALAWAFAQRDDATEGTASLFLTALAFAGAMRTFDMRPSAAAALLLVLALRARTPLRAAAVSAIWINVHPSALLAPLVVFLAPSGSREAPRRTLANRFLAAAVSAAALLANPYGWRGVAAPLSLLTFVKSGAFVNAEWLPSTPAQFPLLYVSIAIALIVLGTTAKETDRGELAGRALLFALLAFLAVRHARDQGLFFAAFPLLVTPSVRRVRVAPAILTAAAMLIVIASSLTHAHGAGMVEGRFPLRAVERLRASGLEGNIYNPDQFGGLLIWSFYPERRALTDGRNELYHAYIPLYARARTDSRAWHALLARYRIDLAVDEYRAPLQVTDARSGRTVAMPASLAYWPRRDWALIGWDEAAMVFARRAAFAPQTLARWEIRGVVPDAAR